MSGFYLGSSSHSHTSDSDDDALPYPEPLPRSVFLAPGFSPQAYLSTLHNRHQTLEDLRSELRSRSQLLSRELLDLVNSNYQDFLGLGRSLKGGDERVEEVRVGLLGFRKEVEACKQSVGVREAEVGQLVEGKVQVRRQIMVGRRLVEYEARLKALEELLVIEIAGKESLPNGAIDISDSEGESEDEEEDDDDTMSASISKLRKNVLQYRVVLEVEKSLGEHPFVAAQTPRMMKVRNTLLLDLNTALQQTKAIGHSGAKPIMRVVKIYADMDEPGEAVKVLKSLQA